MISSTDPDREDRGGAGGAGGDMEVQSTRSTLEASVGVMKSLFTRRDIDVDVGTASAALTSLKKLISVLIL
jgi:hypothetical protein